MSRAQKVLIVDDDKDLVTTMKVVFEANGFAVSVAYNGKECLESLQKKKPDAIVLDVMMRTLTEGVDLARTLKDSPEYRKIPIILVTGFPKEMSKLGPEQFQGILGDDWPAAKVLEKPQDPEKILASVQAVLKDQWKP